MSIPMPPPPAPYSLRVELFADPGFAVSEKPIRCFRVSTQPSATVREFCIKACSTYKINYGEILTVKKCQDDEGFDITQGEVLGNIFQNKDTIRMVQASANPNPRDSVPPTSALRYEPNTFASLPPASAPLQIEAPVHYAQPSRKRDRENSITRTTANKRQRREILGPDPDLPLPSLETPPQLRQSPSINEQPIPSINGRIADFNVVPSSQGSLDLDLNTMPNHNVRNVRAEQPEIPETPSPPSSNPNNIPSHRSPSTDLQSQKSTNLKPVEKSSNSAKIKFKPQVAPAKEQFPVPNTSNPSDPSNPRATSASYHIPGGERGISVSTAATSPLSEEVVNGSSKGASKRKSLNRLPNSAKKLENGNGNGQPPVDKSIWDVPSGDEGDDAAVNSLNKATRLKIRNSPKIGLLGRDFANRIKTPPNNPRRNSRTGTNGHTPGELPLTPGSRERYEKQKQESEHAKEPRAATAAALAAEQRRRQAEEKKAADEERTLEEQRLKREEQEKLQKDEAKRAAAAEAEAEAARLRVELADREKKEAAEAKRKAELKVQEAKRKDEESIAKEKAESKRLRIEAEEAKRVREVDEERIHRERSASAAKKASELAQAASRVASDSAEPRPNRRSVSGTPAPNRPQSSTPFIPSGRKSSLKSSPSIHSRSPDVGIEAQMPLPKNSLPKDKNRRISFADGTKQETPIKPPTKVLPRKAGATPIPVPKSVPARSVPGNTNKHSPVPSSHSEPSSSKPSSSTPKPVSKVLPPARKSTTPILPPILKGNSKERSNSPLAIKKHAPAQKKASPPADKKMSKSMPPPAKITPPAQASSQVAAARIVSVEEDSEASESGSDSDSNSASRPVKKSSVAVNPRFKPVKPQAKELSKEKPEETKSASVHPVEPEILSTIQKKITPETKMADDEQADDASERSSARDSRSPITFSQHPQPAKITKPQRKVSPASESSSDEEDDEDEIMEDAPAESKASKSDSESNNESSSEEEEAEEPKSSPQLPPRKTLNNSSITGKDEFDEGDTQEELANQLTSDHFEARPSYNISSDIKYPPTSSAIPLPPSSRPLMKFGASLSQLNSRKPFLATMSMNGVTGPQLSQRVLKQHDSDEEEEESNDDTSSEDEAPKKKPIVPAPASQRFIKAKSPSSGSDSDDSDSSVSETESVKEKNRIQAEISAQIAGMEVKGSQASDVSCIPSPQILRSQAGYGKSAGRKMGVNMFSKPGL